MHGSASSFMSCSTESMASSHEPCLEAKFVPVMEILCKNTCIRGGSVMNDVLGFFSSNRIENSQSSHPSRASFHHPADSHDSFFIMHCEGLVHEWNRWFTSRSLVEKGFSVFMPSRFVMSALAITMSVSLAATMNFSTNEGSIASSLSKKINHLPVAA